MVTIFDPIAKLFWDCDYSLLSWEQHQDFIIRRILQHGDLNALRWLRAHMTDDELRDWIINHRARGLSPHQIRYWSLMLGLESSLADQWVKAASESLWEKRR